MAIFNNEDELLKGAFRAFPKLKSSTDKFEYGYRLREFPDDEVKTIAHHASRPLLPLHPRHGPHRPLTRPVRRRGGRGFRYPPAPSHTPSHTLTPPHAPSQVKIAQKDAAKESTNPFMHATAG